MERKTLYRDDEIRLRVDVQPGNPHVYFVAELDGLFHHDFQFSIPLEDLQDIVIKARKEMGLEG